MIRQSHEAQRDCCNLKQKEKTALKSSKPEITIIVLCYNNLNYTIQTINSIRDNTNTPYQIIAIDNGSTDGTIKWLIDQPGITIIKNSLNLSFSEANNQGIVISNAPYSCLISNDVIVTPNWAEQLKWHLDRDETSAIIGPMTNEVSGIQKIDTVPYTSIATLYEYAKKRFDDFKHQNTSTHRVVFFCTMFKTEIFRKIGLLDKDFLGGNYEDDDFCIRVLKSGQKNLIATDTFVHHYGSLTLRQDPNNYKNILEQNRKIFLAKHKDYLNTL